MMPGTNPRNWGFTRIFLRGERRTMKASKFSDAQKAFILKQGNDGALIARSAAEGHKLFTHGGKTSSISSYGASALPQHQLSRAYSTRIVAHRSQCHVGCDTGCLYRSRGIGAGGRHRIVGVSGRLLPTASSGPGGRPVGVARAAATWRRLRRSFCQGRFKIRDSTPTRPR
jgi:hypothetical protein